MAAKVDQFIPELWANEILRAKQNSLVYGALANRNYEGLIRDQGDRVRINQIGEINVNSYTKNSTSDLTIQFLSDGQEFLDIDQAKYFAFRVDDIDKVQANIDLVQEASGRAAYRLNNQADSYLAGLSAQCGITRNTSSSPVDMTSTNIEEEFLSVLEELRLGNADDGRLFAVIPPWVLTKLVIAGITSLTDNTAEWRNGFVGRAYGFNMFVSNNVAKDSTSWDNTQIICGVQNESYTWAEQIVKISAYEQTHEGFGQVVKGLHVYGGKIIRPDVTACLFADKTDET